MTKQIALSQLRHGQIARRLKTEHTSNIASIEKLYLDELTKEGMRYAEQLRKLNVWYKSSEKRRDEDAK